VPDAYFFAVTRWAPLMQVDLSAFANVQAHHARVSARPAVQEAMQLEGLLKK
jgi:glutathione S-transferase